MEGTQASALVEKLRALRMVHKHLSEKLARELSKSMDHRTIANVQAIQSDLSIIDSDMRSVLLEIQHISANPLTNEPQSQVEKAGGDGKDEGQTNSTVQIEEEEEDIHGGIPPQYAFESPHVWHDQDPQEPSPLHPRFLANAISMPSPIRPALGPYTHPKKQSNLVTEGSITADMCLQTSSPAPKKGEVVTPSPQPASSPLFFDQLVRQILAGPREKTIQQRSPVVAMDRHAKSIPSVTARLGDRPHQLGVAMPQGFWLKTRNASNQVESDRQGTPNHTNLHLSRGMARAKGTCQ